MITYIFMREQFLKALQKAKYFAAAENIVTANSIQLSK